MSVTTDAPPPVKSRLVPVTAAPRSRPRVTVVEQAYYQSPDDQPRCVETRYSQDLETDEQPYLRLMKVPGEWTKLDCGWIEEASLLILTNEEGRIGTVIPSREEREASALRVVEVGWEVAAPPEGPRSMHSPERTPPPPIVPVLTVPPGRSIRVTPQLLRAMRLRCRSGMARVTVNLFPN